MLTNKTRYARFGLEMTPGLVQKNNGTVPQYGNFLHLPESRTVDLFFSRTEVGITDIYAERWPEDPAPHYNPPAPELDDKKDRKVFFSHARLEGIVSIRVCRQALQGSPSPSPSPSAIIGLMFEYQDGGRVCVGEFRLDKVDAEPLVVGSATKLRLGFAKNHKTQRRYVAGIALRNAAEDAAYKWERYPWSGQLFWWFAHNYCAISHKDN